MASKPSELVLLDHNFDLHLDTPLDFRGRILVWNQPRHPSISCDDAMDPEIALWKGVDLEIHYSDRHPIQDFFGSPSGFIIPTFMEY